MSTMFLTKKAIIFLFAFCCLLNSCEEQEFPLSCYEGDKLELSPYILKNEVKYEPEKLTYQVGDTLLVQMDFTDSIYDFSRNRSFKIIDFPFQPQIQLYYFPDNGSWNSGFLINEYLIDSVYFERYFDSSSKADLIVGKTLYKDNKYHFELKLVLNFPGKYIILAYDSFNSLDEESNESKDKFQILSSWEFNEVCSVSGINQIRTVNEGENYLVELMDKYLYIDKEIFTDGWTTIEKNSWETPFGTGSNVWEYNGAYGFVVK